MIVLKDSVEVSTSVVLLGQVAEIHDANEAQAARLAAVMLFPAPAAGRSRAVDFETVRSRLASQGFNLSELEFSGSSVLTVSGARQDDGSNSASSSAAIELSQKRADEMVTSAVCRYLKYKAPQLGHVQVELKLTPKQIGLLTAAASARVEISGGREPWQGRQAFRAEFSDRPGHPTAMLIECRVVPLPQVLVAAAVLPKGHVVGPNDVTWKQPSTGQATESFLDREELVIGQETKRQLRAGEPIAAVDIRGVPLVRRGDIVTVVARNQGVVVRIDAKAQADGSLGEPIKLLTLEGRRELNARVSGFHEASVGPSSRDLPAVPGNGTGVRLLIAETLVQQSAGGTAQNPGAQRPAQLPGQAAPSPDRMQKGAK
jgi:flagella basal body P-ring formation protein FlgA